MIFARTVDSVQALIFTGFESLVFGRDSKVEL